MKKYFFSAFVFLFTVSACNQSGEITPTDTFSREISQLKSMHKEGLYLAASAFKKSLTISTSKDLVMNESEMVSDVLTGLRGIHFTASDDFVSSLTSNFSTKNLIANSNVNVRLSVSSMNLNQIYNDSQQQLVQPFLDEILVTDDFVEAKKLAIGFQNRVIASKLTREDKVKLLSLGTSIEALSDFIADNGDEPIRIALSQLKDTKENPNVRVAGCSVNTRSVLAGAVVGFLGGGAAGAKLGCAGGMVAGPVGSATGCVGGAVMGAATGFIGGVIGGIASELLTSCLR